jgi:hypothetical protein
VIGSGADGLANGALSFGHVIRINGQTGTIVGVAPRGFGGTLAGASLDLWVALAARASLVPSEAAAVESRSDRWLDVVIGQVGAA